VEVDVVVVVLVVPVEVVGTTTWANATELPRNKDKPRLLKNANLSGCNDIIHPL
jgi:hypothetical protein